MLHHKDILALGLGQICCFRVVMPKAPDNGHVESGSSRNELEDTIRRMEAHIDELLGNDAPAHSMSFQSDELARRYGAKVATHLLRDVEDITPLIEEANGILDRLKPRDRLKVVMDVMSDLFSSRSVSSEPPQCVVQLIRTAVDVVVATPLLEQPSEEDASSKQDTAKHDLPDNEVREPAEAVTETAAIDTPKFVPVRRGIRRS